MTQTDSTSLPDPKPGRFSFRGPDGTVRPGWGIPLFIVLVAVQVTILYMCVGFAFGITKIPTGEISLPLGVAGQYSNNLPVLLATFIMARLDRRLFTSYGLSAQSPLRLFALGILGGVASLSILVYILISLGGMTLEGGAIHGASAVGYGLGWAFGFLATGVGEEMLWRGYILSAFARRLGFWRGAILSSLLFAAAHSFNPGETFIGLAQVFVAGMVFCALLRATGSLWLGIGVHMAWDWSQSYLYGTADSGIRLAGHYFVAQPLGPELLSGGSAGPEGSLLALPVMALFAFLLVLIGRRLRFFPAAAA